MSAAPFKIMLVCGEPSGDQLGAELMAGLRVLDPAVEITGVGGPAMTALGLKTLFSLEDTAVMGLREVVPKIPKILARVREAADFALRSRPDAVVLIDSPDFTHRIAHKLRQLDPSIATVNYVAPQVWASRSYRAKAMAKDFDLVMALLPFEPKFFESYGLKTVFVGHPVIERAPRMVGGAGLRARLVIAPDAKLLCVLPGSRSNEVRLLLPIFRETVALLAAQFPDLVCVLPVVAHVAARVHKGTKDWPAPLHLLEGEADKFAAFNAANAALAASGTVTTELALARTPMVMAYKLGGLTYALMRPIVSAKYGTLVNILLDREAVPEFVQSRCTPQALAAALAPLFSDTPERAKQVDDLEAAMHVLGQGDAAPSLRAAQALLDFVKARRQS